MISSLSMRPKGRKIAKAKRSKAVVMSLFQAFAIVLTAVSLSSIATAITMDVETHDALISQLAEVQKGLDASDVSFVPTSHRLADLLADRARILEMKASEHLDEEKNSAESKVTAQAMTNRAKGDRESAIQYIAVTESRVTGAQKSRVLLQKAHLLQMVGRDKAALAILNILRKGPKTDEYWTATDLLADLHFKLGEYSIAKAMYSEIQRSPKRNNFSDYRLTWCNFHLDQVVLAIRSLEILLNNPNLDPNIRIDGARDLVIFYSRTPFSTAQIQKISSYAPEVKQREENLRFFSDELKRLGKKKESALVKLHILQAFPKSEETLADKVDLFEILVHVGKKKEAGQMLSLITAADCDEACNDISTNLQKILRGWADEEKTKASPELIQCFVIYSQYKFAQEKPLLLAIKVSQDHKYHGPALAIIARVLAMTKDPNVYESALKAQIVSAEATKLPTNIEKAYKQYLAQGKDETLRKEVALGLMQNLMDQKKWAEAESFGLDQLVKYTFHRTEMAAQLIEIYKTTKQGEKERLFSLRMAGNDFKGKYFENYKRLTVAMVSAKTKMRTATGSDLGLLLEIEPKALTVNERYRLLTDSFLLALQLKDFPRLKSISQTLTSIMGKLSPKEKMLIIEKRILVADLELDYSSSLYWDSQLKEDNSMARQFRLALKGRLAGKPMARIESDILNSRQATPDQKIWVVQQQLNSSRDPLNLLKKYKDILRRDPSLFSKLTLSALAKSQPARLYEFAANEPALRKTLVGLLANRQNKIFELIQASREIAGLNTKAMAITNFEQKLGRKLEAMKNFENKFLKREKDDVIVLVALSHWTLLNRDFSMDLQNALQNVKVSKAVKPLFDRSMQAQINNLNQNSQQSFENMKNLWETSKIEAEFTQVFQQATPDQRVAIAQEMRGWAARSMSPLREKWQILADSQKAVDTNENLASLYQSLRQDPFQKSLANEIATKEYARGNQLVALFIGERNKDLGGI